MNETTPEPLKARRRKRQPKRLTARLVGSLKPTGAQYDVFDALVRGLTLRVSLSRAKSWTLSYRVGARKRRWTIGPCPTVSLASARKRAQSALTALHDHRIDPAATKRDDRNAETFPACHSIH